MSFSNKWEWEMAANRFPATAFPFVRSGCSPAEPDYTKDNGVKPTDQAWTLRDTERETCIRLKLPTGKDGYQNGQRRDRNGEPSTPAWAQLRVVRPLIDRGSPRRSQVMR